MITIVSMLALVAFGVAALFNVQTDEFPDIQQPIVAVSIVYPGASPDIVEREIVEPIEEAVLAIAGVDRTKTKVNAVDGLAQFTVFFEFSKLLRQHSFADAGYLAAKFGEAVRAVVRQMEKDHHLPLAADHVHRSLDRTVVIRFRRFVCHTYSHVSTQHSYAYLAALLVHS